MVPVFYFIGDSNRLSQTRIRNSHSCTTFVPSHQNEHSMKRTLLSFASLTIMAGFATGQYAIPSTQAPVIGDVDIQIVDTLANQSIDVGPAGANQSYSILDVDFDMETQTEFGDPANTQTAAEFPEADITIDFGFGPAFIDATDQMMEIIGSEFTDFNGNTQAIHWEDPQTIIEFPGEFESSFTDTGKFQATFYIGQTFQGITIDSGRINYEAHLAYGYDGYGTLETPIAQFNNVLRQRVEERIQQGFEVCIQRPIIGGCDWQSAATLGFPPTDETTVSYSWYNAESKFPLAEVTLNETEDTVLTVEINNDPAIGTGIGSEVLPNGAVYPNPVTDRLHMRNIDVASLSIRDLSGREVLVTTSVRNSVDVSSLRAGSYILHLITTDGEQWHTTLIKQ